MKKYNVSIRKPNKRLAISQHDRKERILEYLNNVWCARYFFKRILMSSQQLTMEIKCHFTETSRRLKKHFPLKVFVKENYMLSRERITAYTQILSKEPFLLPPDFLFKGKGKRIVLNQPPDVHVHWADKDSYHIETMLDTIKHPLTRGNPWSCKDFSIYVLYNYTD